MANGPQSKIVEVPGVGNVEFPASMSDADISGVILKQTTGSESYMAAHPPSAKPMAMQPSYSTLALSNSPSGSDPHNPGNPNLNAVPEPQREGVNDAALTTQMASLGGGPFAEAALTRSVKPLIPVAKAVAGSIAGHYVGREAGSALSPFFGPRSAEVGGTIGSLAGGLYGGSGGRVPTRAEVHGFFEPQPEMYTGTAGSFPAEESAVAHGSLPDASEFYSSRGKEIATAMKQQPGAFGLTTPEPPIGSVDNPGFHSKLPARLPPSLRGDPFAPTPTSTPVVNSGVRTGVSIIPEPRAPFEGENEGYMASVGRSKLPKMAVSGKPGAGKQIQQLGGNVLYLPNGSEIESPNISNLREAAYGSDAIPQGNPTPFGPNASGESSASQEAINRLGSEKSLGVKRFAIDTRSGTERPLIGVDAVDAKPGPYDQIVMRDKSGNETVLDQGVKALPRRPRKP